MSRVQWLSEDNGAAAVEKNQDAQTGLVDHRDENGWIVDRNGETAETRKGWQGARERQKGVPWRVLAELPSSAVEFE